ncbi:MAG: hypothetical protein ACP5RC_12055 [Halothiobacillaceae bacterium]
MGQLEILHRLFRDQHPVRRLREPVEDRLGAAAAEIGVGQVRDAADAGRVDPVEILQVGADIGEAVQHRLGRGDFWKVL